MPKHQILYEECMAHHVYLLMEKNHHLSRNQRMQWYFKNLNNVIEVANVEFSDAEDQTEFRVISVIPQTSPLYKDLKSSSRRFRVVPSTLVTFLAQRYSFVFCLDLSPSVAVVDVHQNEILIDEISLNLERCLRSLTRAFYVPGSTFLFQPQLFITVIAQIPYGTARTHQVLAQAWSVTDGNLDYFLKYVNTELLNVEARLAEIIQSSHNWTQRDVICRDIVSSILLPPPENDFISLVQQGILATHLLPQSSITGIIIVTDGIVNVPDVNLLDAILDQFRKNNLSCSFLQLGTLFHPQSCFGYIPFSDLLHFIAFATGGCYFTKQSGLTNSTTSVFNQHFYSTMNSYHSLFIWSFQYTLSAKKLDPVSHSDKEVLDWNVGNRHFFINKELPCLKKKHQGNNIHTSLFNVLSCRLREGYMMKNICLKDNNHVEVTMVLPWKHNVNLLYVITTVWPSVLSNHSCHYEVIIESTYEFLLDFTFPTKGANKSYARTTVIKKFWSLLHGLGQTDHLLDHLQSFAFHSCNYSIPESAKRRVPLFSLTPNCSMPVLYSSDFSYPSFQAYWKPVCMLDFNIWQKWMHTHRINLILEHDQPLPKYLHLPNISGRYQIIQCRQATASLQALLTDWCSFILVENHSYVKFLHGDPEKPPYSFCLTRITGKAPCIVIRLAFLSGTPNHHRFEIVQQLKEKILSLSFPQRPMVKDTLTRKGLASSTVDRSSDSVGKFHLRRGSSQVSCCNLLLKPLDKILIKYEKIPSDFSQLTSVTTMGSVGPTRIIVNQKSVSNFFPAIYRYLYHRRWIWVIQNGNSASIGLSSVGRLLGTLIKIRLQEGFSFSHSYSGIISMVLEVEMKQNQPIKDDGVENFCVLQETEEEAYHCLIQYVLFPPTLTKNNLRESISEEDAELDASEVEGELQLICECWVEPQVGVVTGVSMDYNHLEGLNYKDIAEKIFERDHECISTMLTFEHLNTLYQRRPCVSDEKNDAIVSTVDTAQTIQFVPFVLDMMHLLPKCHQAELLFSTYIQDLDKCSSAACEYNSETDMTNQLLFDLLNEHLTKLNDLEFRLKEEEHLLFLEQVMQRENDVSSQRYSLNLPKTRSNSVGKKMEQDFSTRFLHSRKMTKQSAFDENDEDKISSMFPKFVQWKCFVKRISISHLILTFLPASFVDLKRLALNASQSCSDTLWIKYYEENEPDSLCSSGVNFMEQTEQQRTNLLFNSMINEETSVFALNFKKGSIFMPVYVYDCPLVNLVNQLIYKERNGPSDLFRDFTFKHKFELGEDTVTLRSDTQSSENSKFPSPEPYSEESNNDLQNLKFWCNSLELLYSKCFVIGLFKNLHFKRLIHPCDVHSAIDVICSESLLEIDITNFLQTVCRHVREFKVKTILEKLRTSHLSSNLSKSFNQDEHGVVPPELAQNDEILNSAQNIPLASLQFGSDCILELHQLIKNKFNKILHKTFLPIPTCQDFFFYCPPNFQQNLRKSESFSGNEIENISTSTDDDRESETFKSETVEFRSEHGSTSMISNKPVKLLTCELVQDFGLKTTDSSESLEGNADLDSIGSLIGGLNALNDSDGEDCIPPLFIHLLCSVRSKSNIGSCSVQCIPACLGEILECLEPAVSEIDLKDFQVTLDITCLTLPPDLEAQLNGKSQSLQMTFCSVSPMSSESQIDMNVQGSSSEDEYRSDSQGDQLAHLPEFQHRAVTNAVEEIKWMLRDEIASAMLNSFPMTKSMLDMVASHVQSSPGRPGCVLEEVPLQFVFGPEQSLDKFIQEFRPMTLTGYQLKEEGNFYYLVVKNSDSLKLLNDNIHANVGLASKFLFIQPNPHSDDTTALYQMRRTCHDLGATSDESLQHLKEIPSSGEKQCFDRFHFKKLRHGENTAEFDTETEEGNDLRNENKIRKTSQTEHEKLVRSVQIIKGTKETDDMITTNLKMDYCKEKLDDLRLLTQVGEALHVQKQQQQVEDEDSIFCNDNVISKRKSSDEQQVALTNTFIKKSSSSISLELTEKNEITDERVCKISNWAQMVHKRHASGTNTNTPGMGSDVSSLIGSGQCSNEDGYEGDSSDVENENDWQNDLEIHRPLLPGFWLILQVFNHAAKIFFHSRDAEEYDEQLHHGKEVVKQVTKNIKNICKIVNQNLLLQDLHDTRMCNQLLEPEGSEDIWKHDDHSFKRNSVPLFYDQQAYEDEDGNEYQQTFLKANLDFMPGTFACKIVWQTHFILHPRLKTGPGRTGISRGVQALRTVLNAFSVNNRENMFVYAETGGSVFYLRLNESQCPSPCIQHKGDLTPGSRSSSMVTLPVKKLVLENDEESLELRPRVNSASDRDHTYDSASVTSRSSFSRLRMEDSIQLLVHGIGEAGPEIREELVKVLQNRLDEAVLDVISVTLFRNPMCKLTKEDVTFLQRPNEEPKTVIHFTIPAHALPYLQAVGIYLRQNLCQFLNIPKYIDNKVDSHFQDFFSSTADPFTTRDGDVFLYNRPQGSGNKGIAIIAFAVVDGLGRPVQYVTFPKLLTSAVQDLVSPFEFESHTATALYNIMAASTKHPGPMALIRFSIWERGKLDMEQLVKKLKSAVHQALWDVVMEYDVLIAPLAESSSSEDQLVYSEPVTPVRAKQFPESLGVKNQAASSSTLIQAKFRELSASVPDLIIKSRSPVTSPKDVATFKLMGSPSVPCTPYPSILPRRDISDVAVAMDAEILRCQETYEIGETGKLHSIYSCVMKEWMEYAIDLGVPSIVKHRFILASRHSVLNFISEAHNIVRNIGMDISLKTFCQEMISSQQIVYKSFPFTLNTSKLQEKNVEDTLGELKESCFIPGRCSNIIIIGRDIKHWRNTVAFLQEEIVDAFALNAFTRLNQKFSPVCQITTSQQDHSETGSSIASNNNATLPFLGVIGQSSISNNSSLSLEGSNMLFVPRQSLLFITIIDREVKVYTYNWAIESLSNFIQLMSSLVLWTNARSDVLKSLVLQKLGLFCNQPSSRNLKESQEETSGSCSIFFSTSETELLKSSSPNICNNNQIHSRRHAAGMPNATRFWEMLHDIVPPQPLHKTNFKSVADISFQHNLQIHEISQSENKEQKRKLLNALQGSGTLNTCLLTDESSHLMRQISRIEHYCLTPLLFLPQWRWQVAAARDHTLPSVVLTLASALSPRKTSESRHSSGGSVKGFDTKNRRQSINLPILQSAQSSPNSLSHRISNEEVWHTPLCMSYIQEFVQYLQNLGFVPLQTKTGSPKHNNMVHKEVVDDFPSNSHRSLTTMNPTSLLKNSIHHVQKTLPGGSVIILELRIIEPYFSVVMYTIEGSRLLCGSSHLCNSQFTTAFVDECDRLKVLLHLHSFTYDYHLRSIHSYVSGRQLIFRQGYHLASFLDDFVKYYQKSPNFSWNLVYHDVLTFEDLSVPGDQLYNHLLDHDKMYGMQVLRMIPVIQSSDKESRNEYILVQLTSKKVSYKDSNEIRHTDDFDISLLISQESTSNFYINKRDSNAFLLLYYIILTSRRELYPRVVIETKLGKFRTVATATPIPSRKVSLVSVDRPDLDKMEHAPLPFHKNSFCSSEKSQEIDSVSPNDSLKEMAATAPSSASLPSTPAIQIELARRSSASDTESVSTSYNMDNLNRTHLGIRQESVNYLGYFSTTEELMNQIMMEQAQIAKEQIHKIFAKATVHCRRDSLWKRLLGGKAEIHDGRKRRDEGREMCGLDYSEFSSLLALVSTQSLTAIDPRLVQFSNMHLSWYQGLVKLLINRYTENCRYFVEADGNTQHVVVLNSNYNDHFMLLTVEALNNRAKLCAVFRKHPTSIMTERSSNSHEQTIHRLTEDFINSCCFHLWSCLV